MIAPLQPPFSVMLAKATRRLPEQGALPGGVQYEPKWDGWRCVIDVERDVTIWSRQGKNLTHRFPDLVAAARKQLPVGTVLDGEAVVWSHGRLDFDELQRRLTASQRTITAMVRQAPASFVVFDVLALNGKDMRDLPLRRRRDALEKQSRLWGPPIELSPATTKRDEAARWMTDMRDAGLEGIVAKGLSEAYQGGTRQWLKVKHRQTLDVVCGAVIGPIERPHQVVIGITTEKGLRIAGRSSPLSTDASRSLALHLRPPSAPHPWPAEASRGAIDQFGNAGRGTIRLTPVEPLVVEISADSARSGGSFRHAVRFVRARPDLPVP